MSDGGKSQRECAADEQHNPDYYWIISLVDSQDEDELREEERRPPVVDDAGLVALHGPQAEEEDGGEEEEGQRGAHGAPGQELDGQDLPVLTSGAQPALAEPHCWGWVGIFKHLTSLLETSMSTAKLVMW